MIWTASKRGWKNLENGDRLAGEGSYSTISSNCGVPGGIRTHDPLLRRQPLCPTELQGLAIYYSNVARGAGKGQDCVLYQPHYLDALQRPEIAKAQSATPAITAPAQPRRHRRVTIMPAMNTPIKIDKIACLNFKPKRTAANEPVQAPVTGRGMATNNAKPIRSYLSTTLPRFLVCSKSHCRNRSKKPTLLRNLEMASRNSRIRGTGSRLPMIANGRA